jgi:hypothetical protein
MADSSPYTKEMIFGTEPDSDIELSDESNVEDHFPLDLLSALARNVLSLEKALEHD